MEKMLDRISVIFAFLQQDGAMKLDVVRLVRGKSGVRVDRGRYRGDEVKGADIVSGGRARDYS